MKEFFIGCEESGVVRDACIEAGHKATSCDLLPSRSKKNAPHLIMDVKEAIKLKQYDIIILHPDCTKVAVSGNAHYGAGRAKHLEREAAIQWIVDLWNLAIGNARIGVCLENPVGMLTPYLGKPQYIQPYKFGHDASKRTGLWLYNLPKLIEDPSDYIPPRLVNNRPRWDNQTDSGQNNLAPSATRKRDRSETYAGIARAMAKQWGNI